MNVNPKEGPTKIIRSSKHKLKTILLVPSSCASPLHFVSVKSAAIDDRRILTLGTILRQEMEA